MRRFIWANFPEEAARDAVRVLRDPTDAGDEAQVDYGLLGRWVDPVSGRTRRVWGFIIVLVYSRLLFLRPVLSMDQTSWVEAHVAAVEFFGGCPARIVPDNLKTGVIKPDLYDPKINRAFGEFALHYGCLIDPARVAKPRDKGLSSHCTSWRWLGQSTFVEPVAHAFDETWVAGGRQLEEPDVLVVGLVGDEEAGAVPGLDGRGVNAESCGEFGDGEQPLGAQPLEVAGEAVAVA